MILLFFVALIAGTFDTIVGGGGLITLPAILMTGLPPHVALGTNKLQSSCGSGSASLHFILKERQSIKKIGLGLFFTIMRAIMGTTAVLHLRSDNLMKCIPPILLVVLLYAIFSKQFRLNKEAHAKISQPLFMIVFGLMLGAYDGFLGAGVGALWAAAFIFFLGFSARSATIYTKILNFTSNIIALIGFTLMHQVNFKIGISMALGQFIGGQIGAHLILKEGHRIIRPIYIIMVTLMLIALSYKTYFGGHL